MLLIRQSLSVLETTAQKQTQENLKTFAHSFIRLIPPASENIDVFLKDIASRNPGFRVTVINPDGVVLGDSDASDISKLENHGTRKEVKAALSGREETAIRRSTVNHTDVMYYAIPLKYDGKNMALRLSMPVAQSVYFTSDESSVLIVTSIFVLVIIMLSSFVISAYLVRQINDLQKATEQYRAGNFDYRPSIRSPRELQYLSESIGDMAQKINQNIIEISRQRDEFEAVFTGITEGLIVFDAMMYVLEYNNTAANLFETDVDYNSHQTLAQLVRNSEILKLVDRSLKTAGSSTEKMVFVQDEVEAELHVDGELRSVFVRCIRIDDDSEKNRFLLVLTDITRNKRLEQVRKDFVANVSHELKTPVTSIKGFTETLLESAMDDKDTARHFLEIIDTQSSRLMNIIEDLLTLSRLEQNQEPLETNQADLTETVRNVCKSSMSDAKRKNISLQFISSEKKPIFVDINPGLFSQAIGNLLDNSIKYCSEGSAIICSALCEYVGDKSSAAVIVEDNGKGIPSVYRDRIFERFFRVDKGRSRDNGGTGLGLSIVRHIIQLHNGTVRCVERPDGKAGARFEIRIPCKI
jgi:two-component system phosphate regulon sensor histidine kinase PhoR